MPLPIKTCALPAMLAAFSLAAPPAMAAELPVASRYEPAQAASEYGRGWRHGHRYRHRSRTTAGDVLGAVLVLGTIAAVAGAARNAERARSYPYPDRYPYPERRGYRADDRRDSPRGLEGAADLCLREIERDARVDDVSEVVRDASGWLVTGRMADGESFACSIGADGRIERIEIGGRVQEPDDYGARPAGDEAYRADGAEPDDGPLPDYPGGPLPGDEFEDESREPR